jgi:transcription-repair coupling factor (superfamily II helicase)
MLIDKLDLEKLAGKQIWAKLHGCSLELALAEFCQKQTGIKLCITEDNLTAAYLKDALGFFLADKSTEILFFPDWETLPYDQFSPHQDIISDRLSTLNRLQSSSNAIIISAASTLMQRLYPPSFVNQYALMIKVGENLNLELFREKLSAAGYHHVNRVLEHGEFTIRGSIIDLFPMGSHRPFRIELFDDEIESLRYFDTETQLSTEKTNEITVLAAREIPLNDQSISLFRSRFREMFPGNPGQCPIYENTSEGKYTSGLEYYLPLFFDKTLSFFDYLPAETKICLIENVYQNASQFMQEVQERYEQLAYDITRPVLKPEALYLNADQLMEQINQFKQLRCYHDAIDKKGQIFDFNIGKPRPLPIDRKAEQPLQALNKYCQDKSKRYLLIAETAGRREILLDLLKQTDIKPVIVNHWQDFLVHNAPIAITTGPLINGAELIDSNINIIVESQLFGEQAVPQRRSSKKTINPDLIIKDMAELAIGAPVVHLQFGVGRYQGMKYIKSGDFESEFIIIAYAGEDKIYVPVTSLHMISRYTGTDAEHAPLHKLGSDLWQKEKKKAEEKIHDVAIELLDVYAKRAAKPGHVYTFDRQEYQRFASGFPFTETNDQLQAIEQIIEDLKSTRPMDRLICGDVGFGKTEVAMRAAFLAVENGRQVAVLTPTTLLAGQHFSTFSDRFADFPVQVELLSRFRSTKETKSITEAMKAGKIDIVIGTHKLLQKDISFKNLGLLIIDEEHRFGVKQKEYIKSLRNHIDILSMTATPIPRTLNMAMASIRDISLIATPPAKRLAVKTFWQSKEDSLLREAILREILRGGQVYFLHNNVQTIDRIVQELEKLVPEAKIQSAHGQMPERELERIMSEFYHHRFNVLVCTTIIETGIDIPTANTIIIDRADKFGLAQLHQLRGRVGRSHHQAYAYLLTPHKKLLTKDAVKRLEAIVSLEDLGAGFTLATHDLEIRGAGELLGEEQSGNMQAVGFNLYMEMLDKAVKDLKSGKTPELSAPMNQGCEIDIRISAIIPEDYIADIHNRLIMYKRIANAESKEILNQLQVELIDRFGLLPQAVKNLFMLTELKILANKIGIQRISLNKGKGKINFNQDAKIDPAVLIQLIQTASEHYQMEGPTCLKFTSLADSPEAMIQDCRKLIKQIAKKDDEK